MGTKPPSLGSHAHRAPISVFNAAAEAEFSKPRGNGSFGVHAAVRTAAHLPLAEAVDYPEPLKEPFARCARLGTCSEYLVDSHRASRISRAVFSADLDPAMNRA